MRKNLQDHRSWNQAGAYRLTAGQIGAIARVDCPPRLVMAEERDQNDDRERHAKHQQQNGTHRMAP
jgi:hypothetical protein